MKGLRCWANAQLSKSANAAPSSASVRFFVLFSREDGYDSVESVL